MQAEIQRPPTEEWDFWTHGLDKQFFGRAYRRAGQVGLAAVLIALGFEQRAIAAGLLCGLVTGLFSTWTVEMTVRILFSGGRHAGVKLAVAAFVKMPFLLAGLFGIAWAGDRQWVNIFAVICGVMLIHGTMLVMTVATAVANQATNRERYR